VIALIDYGAGNLTSVKKALTALGAEFVVPSSPADCDGARGLIVPGVGHFAATQTLDSPWRNAVGAAIGQNTPLLGICLGMQWLFEGSDEEPSLPGLGALSGRCRLLRGDHASRAKIPHVGWNALELTGGAHASTSRLLAGLDSGEYVYFTHSFAAPITSDCVAAATHAEAFAAVVERDNVFGVQFHPEKSGAAGLQILRNFLAVCGC
jgi:imidazole glycerol-phosphate synthase subunit HisH